MAVSGGVIRAALDAVGARTGMIRSDAVLAAGADEALRQAPAGLTAAGAASFLATCAQESDYFRTTVEYGGRDADYFPYVGRGFVQCTWQTNYGYFGEWCHRRGLLDDPRLFVRNWAALADYRWAWSTAVWYFERHDLWRHANRGDHWSVSQGVNRGVNAIGGPLAPRGWPARNAMFEAFLRAGPALLPAPPADDGQRRRRNFLLN